MGGSLRALVVDDQYNVRAVIRTMLTEMGYFNRIDEASDGEEAWTLMNLMSYDLVLADINMPKLDGVELLKRCQSRSALRDVPFLMVTGEATQNWVANAGEWGAFNYILKPFSYTLFKKRIDNILNRMKSPAEAFYRKLEEMKNRGDLDLALLTIQKWEQDNPTQVKLLNLKGEILMAMHRIQEAADCFEAAIELAPMFLMAYKNYGELQKKLGNAEKAIGALEKAYELSPMDLERQLSLGKLLLETGQKEKGKQFLTQALKDAQAKDVPEMRKEIADAFLSNGMYLDAEEAYIKVVKRDAGNVEHFNRLAIALRKQEKYKDAIYYYNLALRYHPNNSVVHYNLGVLHFTQNDRKAAIRCFERAIELDPHFDKAIESLARITRMEKGKPKPKG